MHSSGFFEMKRFVTRTGQLRVCARACRPLWCARPRRKIPEREIRVTVESGKVKVLVIGGGPAGSLSAALLARSGVDVLLLEKEVFPRYHIGEALASSCRSVLELAGAAEKVDEFGFVDKHGGLFAWGAEENWAADWTEIFGPDVRSWSVDRSEFDHLLLQNAGEQGARVIQNATVKRVVFDGERPVAAEWVDGAAPDRLRTTRFDFLIDASGRAACSPRSTSGAAPGTRCSATSRSGATGTATSCCRTPPGRQQHHLLAGRLVLGHPAARRPPQRRIRHAREHVPGAAPGA